MAHLQDIKTDSTARNVNIWMKAWGVKLYRGRSVGIVRGKRNGNFECEASVNLGQPLADRLGKSTRQCATHGACWPFDRTRPFEQVGIRLWERGLWTPRLNHTRVRERVTSGNSRYQVKRTSGRVSRSAT